MHTSTLSENKEKTKHGTTERKLTTLNYSIFWHLFENLTSASALAYLTTSSIVQNLLIRKQHHLAFWQTFHAGVSELSTTNPAIAPVKSASIPPIWRDTENWSKKRLPKVKQWQGWEWSIQGRAVPPVQGNPYSCKTFLFFATYFCIWCYLLRE